MLAIMNIGKYSSPGVVPSGTDLFTISASQSLGQAVDFFARKGSTILALPYMQNVIYQSTDSGATWSTVSMEYYLSHIFYSPIKDKFYALELGDENVPQTLHYGVSDDGLTWTWNTLYTNSTAKMHYYGTYIEESNNDIAFDLLKVDSTTVNKGTDTATASHIRVFTNNTEAQIGDSCSVTVFNVSSSTTVSDFYPLFNTSHAKTKDACVHGSWKAVGYGYNVVQKITVGSWGVNEAVGYSANGYSYIKAFDKFYHSLRTSSGSSSSLRYYTELYCSPTERSNTWVQYTGPRQTSSTLAFTKMYGYFQLGNYYYMAYQDDTVTKWYRAGDIQTLVNAEIANTFYKADLTGVPVSEYSLDNKHFLLSMADGKVYLCEAT